MKAKRADFNSLVITGFNKDIINWKYGTLYIIRTAGIIRLYKKEIPIKYPKKYLQACYHY